MLRALTGTPYPWIFFQHPFVRHIPGLYQPKFCVKCKQNCDFLNPILCLDVSAPLWVLFHCHGWMVPSCLSSQWENKVKVVHPEDFGTSAGWDILLCLLLVLLTSVSFVPLAGRVFMRSACHPLEYLRK